MPKLRNVTIRELGELYNHMKRDFPANERLPYYVMRRSVAQGLLKACYMLEDTGGVCGYALCVLPFGQPYVHVQYLAILPAHRSKGYGTAMLELLEKRYGGRKILLEVEDPEEAEDSTEKLTREKRIQFYQRAGFRMIAGMKLVLFGIPMLCMTNQTGEVPDPQALWKTAYHMAMGQRWMTRFVRTVLDSGTEGEEADPRTIRPGRYRHFKGGEYRVLYLAHHSETQEEMVVYQALYGTGGIWVRPASMWNETVTRDGLAVRRFTYIGEE